MKVRYKKTNIEAAAIRFNIHAIGEVVTGDDLAYIHDLDVFLPALGKWKDMAQAFRDKDLIPDNYNTYFVEPPTAEDRERGYLL